METIRVTLVVMMFIFLSTTIALTIYYEVEKKNHLEIETELINKVDSLNYELSKAKGDVYYITPEEEYLIERLH